MLSLLFEVYQCISSLKLLFEFGNYTCLAIHLCFVCDWCNCSFTRAFISSSVLSPSHEIPSADIDSNISIKSSISSMSFGILPVAILHDTATWLEENRPKAKEKWKGRFFRQQKVFRCHPVAAECISADCDMTSANCMTNVIALLGVWRVQERRETGGGCLIFFL